VAPPAAALPLHPTAPASIAPRLQHGVEPAAVQTSLLSFEDAAAPKPRFTRRRLATAAIVTAAGVGLGAGLGYLVQTSRSRPRPAPPAPQAAGPVVPTASDTEVAMSTATPAPDSTARVMAVKGELVVRSQPAGALVTIDGALSGETPVTVRDLSLGTHLVQIARPGHEPRVERVTLTSGAPVQRVNVELVRGLDLGAPMRGAITVDSRPRGARVSIDGKYIGRTPLRWPDALPGAHQVVLDLAGYARTTIPVTVRQGEPARVAATLRAAASKDRE
jgi:hypothetical protein